eukprot:TRINITY_DN38187_c0_g1_i1.p1 TRINITY_DN38187_c0_g1~~TRINITY_DN38187_c0_g1_i1.p1  ORF type:complete len:288 (+),score=21.51 TRINITY_DN38187_c0_g1_i1:56-865(+)
MAARRALRDLARIYRAHPGFHKCRSFDVPRPLPAHSASSVRGMFTPRVSERCAMLFPGRILDDELQNLKKSAEDRLFLKDIRPPEDRKVEDLRFKVRKIPCDCVSGKECLSIVEEKEADESLGIVELEDRFFLRSENIIREEIKELETLEKKKKEIDREAEKSVKKEFWFGGFLMLLQSMALMRLTFWELSWDVMEPICFFLTNAYFLVGYSYFLATKTQPSLPGLYRARFKTKQKRLMKMRDFDVRRFNELRNLRQQSRIPRGILDAL